MSQPAVIRALPMFTKDGASKKINLVREIAIGLGLGISLGMVWQVMHIYVTFDVLHASSSFAFGFS
jgi:hypothetical protein